VSLAPEALGLADALLQGGGGPGCNLGRVADDEVRAPVGKDTGAGDVDAPGEVQSSDVFACAGQGPRADVGGDDVVDSPVGQDGRPSYATGALRSRRAAR
jgi:hypothetical protein